MDQEQVTTLRQGIVADIVNVSTAALRITEFAESSPEDWFVLFETACRLHSPAISVSTTKYDHLLSQTVKNPIAFRIVKKYFDVAPDGTRPARDYESAKTALIRKYGKAVKAREKEYNEAQYLPEVKPSDFFMELQILAEKLDYTDAQILRHWNSKLPTSISSLILVSSKVSTEDKLELADQLWEDNKLKPVEVCSTSSAPFFSKKKNGKQPKVKQKGSKPSKPKKDQSVARQKIKDSGLCWYHFKFGNEATKCSEPCSKRNTKKGNDQQ